MGRTIPGTKNHPHVEGTRGVGSRASLQATSSAGEKGGWLERSALLGHTGPKGRGLNSKKFDLYAKSSGSH